jgi:hypothetical protein
LDQKKFDHNPNKKMDAVFLEELRLFIKNNASESDELLRTLKGIKFCMIDNVSYVSINVPNKEPILIKWEKGLLSGLRWTALMGTVYNYAILYVARRFLSEILGVHDRIRRVVAQGDDDDIEVCGAQVAVGLIKAYEEIKIPVNTKKFFIDTERHEYLRKVGIVDNLGARVTGYPARAVNSLLWRNPINVDPPKGAVRIEEQVKQWMVLVSRGCVYKRVRKHLLQDISRANSISKRKIVEILRTPRYRGGFGLEGQDGCLGIRPEVYKKEFKRLLPYGNVPPGLVASLDYWGMHGVVFNDEDIDDYIGARVNTNLLSRKVRDFKLYDSSDDIKVKVGDAKVGGIPLVAPVNKKLFLTLRDTALRKKIRLKDWEWIHGVYIDPQWEMISRRIESRGSRRVWLAWVLGEFKFSPPIHHLFSSEATACIHKKNAMARFSSVIYQRRFNMLSIRRAEASAELDTYVELRDRVPILGE